MDSIISITYTYEGVTTQFLKKNDIWVNDDDRTMELDQDKVENLITEVNNIYLEITMMPFTRIMWRWKARIRCTLPSVQNVTPLNLR